MLFEERQRNLLGQAITSIAAGLLFLRYFSNEIRFLIEGFVIVVISCLFLIATLGSVVKPLRRLREFMLKYGSNLWFALMIISLIRVLIAAIGTPDTGIPSWVVTTIPWIGSLWFLVFSGIFIALSWFEIAEQFHRNGPKKGRDNLLVSIAVIVSHVQMLTGLLY
jgi:hypothetical protein